MENVPNTVNRSIKSDIPANNKLRSCSSKPINYIDTVSFMRYQEESEKTVLDSIKNNPAYFALGLSGEAGEVAELIKKSIRDNKAIDKNNLTKELGDVLWYLSQLANAHGIDLSDIAITNLEKLKSRKKRGKLQGSGNDR